jgi:hypothetical protein
MNHDSSIGKLKAANRESAAGYGYARENDPFAMPPQGASLLGPKGGKIAAMGFS